MGVEGGMRDRLVAGRGAVRAASPEPDALGDTRVGASRHARPRPGVRRRRAARGDPAATGRWSSCRTSRRSRGSSTRRSRCPTSTRDTASRSAASPRPSSPTASSRRAASGYDINCGVRLLALPLDASELGRRVASRSSTRSRARSRPGPASAARCSCRGSRSRPAARGGAARSWSTSAASAREDDLEHTESEGCLPGADPAAVSERARVRGSGQLGTIGSGNHFVEVQRVDRVFDAEAAGRSGCARSR